MTAVSESSHGCFLARLRSAPSASYARPKATRVAAAHRIRHPRVQLLGGRAEIRRRDRSRGFSRVSARSERIRERARRGHDRVPGRRDAEQRRSIRAPCIEGLNEQQLTALERHHAHAAVHRPSVARCGDCRIEGAPELIRNCAPTRARLPKWKPMHGRIASTGCEQHADRVLARIQHRRAPLRRIGSGKREQRALAGQHRVGSGLLSEQMPVSLRLAAQPEARELAPLYARAVHGRRQGARDPPEAQTARLSARETPRASSRRSDPSPNP